MRYSQDGQITNKPPIWGTKNLSAPGQSNKVQGKALLPGTTCPHWQGLRTISSLNFQVGTPKLNSPGHRAWIRIQISCQFSTPFNTPPKPSLGVFLLLQMPPPGWDPCSLSFYWRLTCLTPSRTLSGNQNQTPTPEAHGGRTRMPRDHKAIGLAKMFVWFFSIRWL